MTQIIDECLSLYLQFKSKIFAQGVCCSDNLFALDLRVLRTKGPITLVTAAPVIPFLEAHKHLNHLGFDKLERMRMTNKCGGLSIAPHGDSFRNHFLEANMKRSPFHPRESRSSVRLDRIHTDLAGPLSTSIEKHQYFLIIRDNFSCFVWIIMMPSKDGVMQALMSFDNLCLTQYGRHVGAIQSDNGREFVNNTMSMYCADHGIKHLTSMPHHPQMNGAAEQLVGIVKEKIQVLLLQAKFPDFLWMYVAQHAVSIVEVQKVVVVLLLPCNIKCIIQWQLLLRTF